MLLLSSDLIGCCLLWCCPLCRPRRLLVEIRRSFRSAELAPISLLVRCGLVAGIDLTAEFVTCSMSRDLRLHGVGRSGRSAD